MTYNTMDLEEKIEYFTNKTDLCWLWVGTKNKYGYGTIRVAGKAVMVHRVVFTLKYKVIPNNMIICHRCDNPSCIRPDHLFLGTYSDNSRDAYNKGRINKNFNLKTRYKKDQSC